MNYRSSVRETVNNQLYGPTLPSVTRGHANIPHKTSLDNVVKRLHL